MSDTPLTDAEQSISDCGQGHVNADFACALERRCAELERRCAELERIIEEAPHSISCRISQDIRGGYRTDTSRCNCWKSRAKRKEGK